ncbi:myc proto-oncogene protein-like [Bacillus rossius redtenbacheri]|uniref:myc proto-oncogene protein-like n=1 Tax=Bacillus rossius redtenbacheri TaxID=93214 RepID=UPI002FDF0513
MIKWLLSDLEGACGAVDDCKVWDHLDLGVKTEAPGSPPPVWEEAPPPAAPVWRNCMWGGRCGSHDHCAAAPRAPPSPPPPAAPRAGQSLLKSSVLLRAQQPSPPPSPPPPGAGDCEQEMVWVSMRDVVCDVRWTAFPAPAPPPPPPPPPPVTSVLQVHEDHSYHLTLARHDCPISLEHLGVQTPSDSGTDEDFFEDEIVELPDLDPEDVDFFGPESVFKDIAETVATELRPVKKSVSDSESRCPKSESEDDEEEIDVVSVAVDKARALPTNPSVRDRHELQQTVADAVCRRGRRRHHHRHHRRRHHRHHRHHRRGRPKRVRSAEPSDEDYSDDGDCSKRGRVPSYKRSLHNNLERQRRIDLSNLVRSVRQLVPSISEKERAPRIVVLREAADYCRQLQVEAAQLAAYKQELLRVNSKLQSMHQRALHDIPAESLRSLRHHVTRRPPAKRGRRPKE